jgi:hypothetical protein
MRRMLGFEAEDGTLVLFERHNIRISNDKGEEAVIPLPDCLIFLSHLASHAKALGLSRATSEWLKGSDAPIPPTPGPRPRRSSSPPPIAAGESFLVFERDSLLILGAYTEARMSLRALSALLDHLAKSLPPPFSIPQGLKLAMTTASRSSALPLLAPSEWLVFRTVREASTPLTDREIAHRSPSLPIHTIRALAARLVDRRLLSPIGSGWIAESYEPSALLGRMLDHWLAVNDLDNPEDLEALRGFLENKIQGANSPEHEVG